jgi:hypothetical protein
MNMKQRRKQKWKMYRQMQSKYGVEKAVMYIIQHTAKEYGGRR